MIVPVDVRPPWMVVGDSVRLSPGVVVTVKVAVFVTLPRVAEIVALLATATVPVLIVKGAVVAPAGTTTLAGGTAKAAFDERVTVVPVAGAAPFRVTVPVEVVPPGTVAGFTLTPVRTGGVTVNFAVLVTPRVAEMVATLLVATGVVVIVKVAVVAPPETVTLGWTGENAESEASVTAMPPDGAALPMVTVPVEFAPPSTVDGLRVRPVTTGAFTASAAVLVTAPRVAEMFATLLVVTAVVVTVKVPVLAPAATVAVGGTTAKVESELRGRVKPPVGARCRG